jgi:hypothetical protein
MPRILPPWRRRAAIVALGLLANACPRQPGPAAPQRVALGELAVYDRTPGAEQVVTASELLAQVRHHLKQRAITPSTGSTNEVIYDLRMELGLRSAEGGAVALASAAARPRRDGVPLRGDAVERLPAGDAPRALRRDALLRAVGRVLDDLAFQARLAVAAPAALARALGQEKSPQRLAAAIEIAALRRARETVAPLIALLEDERPEIADRAIGALVEIGDRRAVKALAKAANFSDTARLAKVIDAVGTLGGDEAASYLEFVVSGNEDADIRNLAREALERMRRTRPEEPTMRHK